MSFDRRKFAKLAGLTVLGAAAGRTGSAQKQPGSAAPAASAGPDVPAQAPLEGNRWAMVVDLGACGEHEGCRECVKACHEAHNVPDWGNPKDEVKWIWKEPFHQAFHEREMEHLGEQFRERPALLLCNHCDNPPCVKVCPTKATWKREKDGVVMIDWHRCIGCRYCVVGCPYGARSFNWRDPRQKIDSINTDYPTRQRGVAEKCTLCVERLAVGLIPACVEACPHGALTFGDLEDPSSPVRELLDERFAIRRKPELGTHPQVYYLV